MWLEITNVCQVAIPLSKIDSYIGIFKYGGALPALGNTRLKRRSLAVVRWQSQKNDSVLHRETRLRLV
jgi:hypothetical protein